MWMHCSCCGKCALLDYDQDCPTSMDDVLYIYNAFRAGTNANYQLTERSTQRIGAFFWSCLDCNQKVGNVNDSPPWLHRLTKSLESKLHDIDTKVKTNIDALAADIANFKLNVGSQVQQVSSHSFDQSLNSPFRKRRLPPACGGAAADCSVASKTPPPISSPDACKAVLKLDGDDAVSNASALKDMCALKSQDSNQLPDFRSKASKDGSIQVLFKSYKDAVATKKLFEEKFDRVKMKDPVRLKIKRLDLVGLPYAVSKEEAMEGLVRDNPQLGLSLNPDGCSAVVSTNTDIFVSIIDVKPCRDSPHIHRVLIRATESFVALIDRMSIKLLSCVLHRYILPDSIQCYNCQRFGHYADKCKFDSVCSKCASPSHTAKECTSKVHKCINCIRQKLTDISHPAFSQKCPCYK